MKKMKFELDFRELGKGENLYDNVNLDAQSIVDAQYYKVMGEEDNPDLCAIPRMLSAQEVIDLGMIRLPGYDHSLVEKMSKAERLEMIEDLDRVITPLGIHFDVCQAINRLLRRSYKFRTVMLSSNQDDTVYDKRGFGCNIVSIPRLENPTPVGFFLHGKSGAGKTMAVHLAMRGYPQAIRHTFAEYSYVQIPIIMVTAVQKSIRDVYRSIATEIDNILDTGDEHERKVRGGTIAAAEGYVKAWIKAYHIGLIIVDEIQFLDFSKNRKTIEDIVGITQTTGAQFGLIGNNDALAKVIGYERLHRRVANNMIDADQLTDNSVSLFVHAIGILWSYQWTDTYAEMTDGIRDLLLYESARNISLLKYLLTKIQLDAVKIGKNTVVDENFIMKHVGKDMEELRKRLADPEDKEDAEYVQYMARLYARISADISNETEVEKGRILEMISKGELTKVRESVRNAACDTILNVTDYSEMMVNRAVRKVVDEDPTILDHPAKILVRKAMEVLKSAEKSVKNKEKAATQKASTGKKDAAEKDRITRQALAALNIKGAPLPATE